MLLSVLVFTMTASSYQVFALAVLAVDIIDDLAISRTGLGLLGSLNTMVGALTAPTVGRLTDRFGARRAIVVLLLISGAGMAVMALSVNWPLLAASAVVSGIPQGWGNPATNALIAERVPAAVQGTVTGIKQSGVQLGIFLSGLTLPGLAVAVGWRGAMWVYAAAFSVGALAIAWRLEEADGRPPAATGHDPAATGARATAGPDAAGAGPTDGSTPRLIWLISAYAFLIGGAGGAIGRFFPLWANEVVGLSTVVAGILVGLGGLLGIGARIAAGRLAQQRISPPSLLSILALFGALYCATLFATPTVGSWILWPATILSAVGIAAWNAVAMLAVIVTVPRALAGRASGIVMLGFLGGLSVGSPIAGAVVDRWDTYQPVWLAALVLAAASAVLISPQVTGRLRRRQGSTPSRGSLTSTFVEVLDSVDMTTTDRPIDDTTGPRHDPATTARQAPVTAPAAGGDGATRATTEAVGTVDEWAVGTMRMRKVDDRAVAVVRTESGFHAIDNACPHQGYGLATGSLDGELLTCQWHNWKFDVRTGRCLMGEEDVACHPVEIADGEVRVTVTRPTVEEQRARLWPSLLRGIEADHGGQIARDSVRLLQSGASPAEIISAGRWPPPPPGPSTAWATAWPWPQTASP